MAIVSGYQKMKDYIKQSSGYKLLSRWANANTIECDDAQTVQNKIGGITGISSSLTANSSTQAASTQLTNQLYQNITQVNSELNAKILELSPNTAITSISLEKNSTPQDLVIEQSGFYALTALNDRGTDTLMVAIFNANGDCLYSTTIFEATNYSQISTPILRLQAGNYKYRGAGGVINLIHYINQ